jgi:hypothetical protein
LALRLLENEVYRFIASESFLNAGPFRIELREFMRRQRTSLGSLLCPYRKLLEELKRKPRYILFAGSRATENRDARLAQHVVDEVKDRKLARTTPGILICGINHGSRVAERGQPKTLRRRLEDGGFSVLGLRLATDDFDRATCRAPYSRLHRTDTVWPVGEQPEEKNSIRLLDLVTTTAEYTVVPTRNSPFERVTDNFSDTSSALSMAARYELVVLAKRIPEPCRPEPCEDLKNASPGRASVSSR